MSESLIVPGATLCSRCRDRFAEVTLEPGQRYAEDLCFECVELELERYRAVAVNLTAADLAQAARSSRGLADVDPDVRELADRLSRPA